MQTKSKRHEAYLGMFEAFKKEGRELNIGEAKKLYPEAAAALRKHSVSMGAGMRRLKKIFKNEWHEIYETKLNIVHTPVKPTPKTVDISSDSSEELSPLDKLRKARKETHYE